jgi:hypothetical protein
MRLFILAALALCLASTASAQITLQQAQDEADAWMTPRLGDWSTKFQSCFATDPTLKTCHPNPSSTVLPNTAPTDSALATVTNDDPGTFVTGCGGCYEDRNRWVDAAVDIPAMSPCQLRANTLKSTVGTGPEIVCRFSYDGALWEKGYALFGIATGFDWRLIEVIP